MGDAARLDRAGNLLGALSLVIGDRMSEELGDAAGHPQAATALSALSQFLDGATISRMSTVLGLSHSATVRLVDRLEGQRWVRRAGTDDTRAVAVHLTAAGRRAAEKVVAARGAVLAGALKGLPAGERQRFEETLAQILTGQMRGPGATRWMCRLCDMGACERDEGHCPVANAARERWSSGRSGD